MKVKIVINVCSECPHKEHLGVSGRVSFVPRCALSPRRKLPYKEDNRGGSLYAIPTNVIPKWCPLEKDES